jgi:hypothetical protein
MRGDVMDKEKLKKLGEDPRFISGIYNYCDRWCERCPFTSRCMNFELSEEDFADPETRDLQNEAFWNKLSETFQVTLELLKEMAEERGIDLDSIDDEESREESARPRPMGVWWMIGLIRPETCSEKRKMRLSR